MYHSQQNDFPYMSTVYAVRSQKRCGAVVLNHFVRVPPGLGWVYLMADGQSTSSSWYLAPLWGPLPFYPSFL
jgi:hypothetical protein